MLKSGQPFIYAVFHDNTVTIISQSSFYRLKYQDRCVHTSRRLTATERAGSRLPKSSKILITAEMSTIAQKLPKRLPLKFKNIFSAEISAAMNQKLIENDIF